MFDFGCRGRLAQRVNDAHSSYGGDSDAPDPRGNGAVCLPLTYIGEIPQRTRDRARSGPRLLAVVHHRLRRTLEEDKLKCRKPDPTGDDNKDEIACSGLGPLKWGRGHRFALHDSGRP